jgi:hypothetical protein
VLNAISSFSLGNVPNSEDWFGRSGNMMKMLDLKMIFSPTIRKRYARVAIFAPPLPITVMTSEHCYNKAHKEAT